MFVDLSRGGDLTRRWLALPGCPVKSQRVLCIGRAQEKGRYRPGGQINRFVKIDGGEMSCVPARALFHTAPRRLEIRELPTPRPPAGEVPVRPFVPGTSRGPETPGYPRAI